jgi:hypothetical protein
MSVSRVSRRADCVIAVAAAAAIAGGCGADESALRHDASQVAAAFGAAGLPLDRVGANDGEAFEVVPVGADSPDATFTSRSGEGFYVVVYHSVDDAVQVVASAPEIDPIFRKPRSFARRDNVVAVVQPPSAALAGKVETALSGL